MKALKVTDQEGSFELVACELELHQYHRYCVLGAPGSGKTSFSTQLHILLDMPLIQMNDITTALHSKYDRPPTEQEWLSGLSRALEAERWITDGFMQKSIPLRLQLADIIIFLDLSAFVCLWSALKRGWMNLLGRTAPRLINPSSCSIYGDSPDGIVTERSPIHPLTD